jgi:hypothetical protein
VSAARAVDSDPAEHAPRAVVDLNHPNRSELKLYPQAGCIHTTSLTPRGADPPEESEKITTI